MPKALSFTASGFETWDSSSGAENLPPFAGKPSYARLTVAENGRFMKDGGVYVRNGSENKGALGTGVKVDSIHGFENDSFAVMFFKSGTKILQSKNPDAATPDYYDIGVTRTELETDFFFPKRKDLFALNQTDAFLRIFVSVVEAVNVVGGILTVRSGDIDDFQTSGTVYIRGIAVTYSGVAGSTLTGCTGLTADMAQYDIITQTATYASNPKGTCMGEVEGSGLVGGVSADGSALYFSEASNPAEPELFYSFPVGYTKSLPRDISAIYSGSSVTLIGMLKGLQYCDGFNIETGVPRTIPLSSVHRIPNAKSICQVDDDFVVLTAEGRILPAGQTQAGFKIIEDPKNPKNDMDYPVAQYIQENMNKSDTSQNHIHYDSATRTISATILLLTGITCEFVYQRDIGAWSRDTGRNFSCKTTFKGRTYCGSDNSDTIFLQDEGATDDGIPILFRISTGLMSLDGKRITFDVMKVTLGGLLSATGSFTLRILADGSVIYTKEFTAEELIEKKLMSTTSGRPIGSGQIGAEQIGSGGSSVDAFRFTCPIDTMFECETVQLDIESLDENTAIELRDSRIDIETEGEQSFDTF